jgi:predicted negative regulator of RcsB-dependent stress response
MDEDINKEKDFKNKFATFYEINKKKIIGFVTLSILFIIILSFYEINKQKKNNLISEKYIEAGLYLASNDLEKSKILYEQIIFSKNPFYSTLALNTILEKDLEKDSSKILKYFEIIEKIINQKEQNDILNLKKALYLIKNSDEQTGYEILKELRDSNSSLKSIAEEILKD